jgi:hypothetical protein
VEVSQDALHEYGKADRAGCGMLSRARYRNKFGGTAHRRDPAGSVRAGSRGMSNEE